MRSRNLGVNERFIYLRDQFFFSKFSFFSGDLEHYLGHCITQEVKCLSDNEGLHFSFFVMWSGESIYYIELRLNLGVLCMVGKICCRSEVNRH